MVYDSELFEALEKAAIDLSDALTGGGVFATHGREPIYILERASRMDTQIISALTTMNLVLRQLDKRRKYDGVHTCWDECPRLPCAQRREIETLRAELADARAAERAAVVSWLRGHLIYRHLITAIEAGEHLTRDDPVCDTLGDSDGDDGA